MDNSKKKDKRKLGYFDNSFEFGDDFFANYIKWMRIYKGWYLNATKERELFEEISDGNMGIQEIIARNNLRLVVNRVKVLNRDRELDMELIGAGNFGLAEAIKKFDSSQNCRFSTYAYYWIKREIIMTKHKWRHIVHLATDFNNDFLNYYNAIEYLKNKLNREPTSDEVRSYLKVSLEHIELLKMYEMEYLSMNNCIDYEEGLCLEDIVGEDIDFNKNLFNEELSGIIKEVLSKLDLNERDFFILEHIYGLNGKERMSLSAIGKIFSITTERVRQIEKRILKKIRSDEKILMMLGDYFYDDKEVRNSKIVYAKKLENKKIRID